MQNIKPTQFQPLLLRLPRFHGSLAHITHSHLLKMEDPSQYGPCAKYPRCQTYSHKLWQV